MLLRIKNWRFIEHPQVLLLTKFMNFRFSNTIEFASCNPTRTSYDYTFKRAPPLKRNIASVSRKKTRELNDFKRRVQRMLLLVKKDDKELPANH